MVMFWRVVTLDVDGVRLRHRCERYQDRANLDGVRTKLCCAVKNGCLENEVGGGGLSRDLTPKMGGCFIIK